jgi:type VI secretion system protein ImpG
MTRLNQLYQQELKLLKESSQIFADEYPGLTESLRRDSADPDVEMILQGVAYLTAQFRREMDDQFPVALQTLSQALTPSLMQPIAACSILAMKPKSNLMAPFVVKQGRYFDSQAMMTPQQTDEVKYRFSNAWDVTVLPIELSELRTETDELIIDGELQRVNTLKLNFDSTRNDLENYTFDKLRFYINRSITDASLWMLLFSRYVHQINIVDSSGSHPLNLDSINLSGFDLAKQIFNHQDCSQLHQLLQEYYLLPEKFLFVDIDISEWEQRKGQQFELQISFTQPNWAIPTLNKRDIQLYATPVINQFDQYAEPIGLDDTQHEYAIQSKSHALSGKQELTVVDVLAVETVKRNRDRNRRFQNAIKPTTLSNNNDFFHFYRKHAATEDETVPFIALQYPPHAKPDSDEVLRIKTLCSQGQGASQVSIGDINQNTSTSPELVTFNNLIPCTEFQQGVIASNNAWQVISDQALSLNAVQNAEQLKNLLSHHIPIQSKGSAKQKTNLHRIASIERLSLVAKDHFKSGVLRRGNEIHIHLNGEHFTHIGELFLFASVLDQLFALQTPINSSSQLIVTEVRTGDQLAWPMRLGTATK